MNAWDNQLKEQDGKLENINVLLEEIKEVISLLLIIIE
jgi:hypothetical protein